MMDLSKIVFFKKSNPISNKDIDLIENKLNMKLPAVYRDLLHYIDGFETVKGIKIFGSNEIIERNETLEVEEYAKGYIAIGDDSGDSVFIMLANQNASELLSVDCGSMDPNYATSISLDFKKWISEGCQISDPTMEQTYVEFYDILLIDLPAVGSKDLIKIKNFLNLDIPMGELLKGSKQLPFVLIKKVSCGKAKKLVDELGELGSKLKLVPSDTNKG